MSLRRFLSRIVGNANERELGQMRPLVNAVNELESTYEALSESDLRAQSDQFRYRLQNGETLDDLLVEAYGVVWEGCRRLADRNSAMATRYRSATGYNPRRANNGLGRVSRDRRQVAEH